MRHATTALPHQPVGFITVCALLCSAMLAAAPAAYGRPNAWGGKRHFTKSDAAIIYGSDSRGPFIPFPPSNEALGGLAHYAGAINSMRQEYPAHFAIDVGNIVNEKSVEERVTLAAAYYDYMKFDAIAPGGGEVAFGLAKFASVQKRTLPIVASNIDLPEGSGARKGLLLSKRGYSLYLINILCRSVIQNGGSIGHDPDTDALKRLLRTSDARRAHIRAAVVHGNRSEITHLAQELPELDVIIAGSLEERINTPVMVGNTRILSAGFGNKFAGRITFKYDRAKTQRISIDSKLYPIFQNTAPDPHVAAMLNPPVSAPVKPAKDSAYYKPQRAHGVIPFLSDRTGRPMVYIKAAGIRHEYTAGAGETAPRKPMISSAGNRAAFIYEDDSSKNNRLRMVNLATLEGKTVTPPDKNIIDAAFSPPDGFIYYIAADSGSNIGTIYKTTMYMYDALRIIKPDGLARRDLSVSDNGATLLWTANVDDKWHVYTADTAADAKPARITNINANHRYPRMSRDGRYVAYLSDYKGFGDRMDLWVFDRKSNTHTQLTRNANVQEFTWKDDSKTLYFSAGINITDINSVNIADTRAGIKKLSAEDDPKTWSESTPRFTRYKGAPKIVYTREYMTGAKRLHWIDTRTKDDEEILASDNGNEWNE